MKSLEDINKYSINLMWINNCNDESSQYLCKGKSKKDMDYEVGQLKKWSDANPGAEVNFWYDRQHTTEKALENTKALLQEKGLSSNVRLKDIREISFVQKNADYFLASIPIYWRIDILKLIICLDQLENKEMDSAIFSDMSIGDKTGVLSKQKLFDSDSLENLNKYGMLIGEDGFKPENQFLQTLNKPELIQSIKHAINSSMLLTTDALNGAIDSLTDETKKHKLGDLYGAPFLATMVHVHLYLLALQSGEKVKIRADIVTDKGTANEWVNYDPEQHGPIMFGNSFRTNPSSSHYFTTKNGDQVRLKAAKRVSTSLKILGHPSPQNSLANATGMPPAALAVLVPLDFQPPTGLKICAPQ